MVMSRDQNAGRTHSMKPDTSYIERVDESKYSRTTKASPHHTAAARTREHNRVSPDFALKLK
jgi:hypothetical protein